MIFPVTFLIQNCEDASNVYNFINIMERIINTNKTLETITI